VSAFDPAAFQLTRDGSLFYRPGAASRGSRFGILDESGKLGPSLTDPLAVYYPPQISPDGRRFAATATNARGIDEIWILDYPQLTRRRLVSDPNADCGRPVWSPDEKQIAYYRTGRDERDGVYFADVAGGTPKRILRPESKAASYMPCAWLGQQLLLERQEGGHTQLARLELQRGEADSSRLQPLLPSSFNEGELRASPDGRLIAFVSDESGEGHVVVARMSPDGAVSQPLEVKGISAVYGFWARDGKSIYIGDSHYIYYRVRVATAPQLALSAPTKQFDFIRLGLDGCIPAADGRFLAGTLSDTNPEITSYDLVLGWSRILAQKLKTAR